MPNLTPSIRARRLRRAPLVALGFAFIAHLATGGCASRPTTSAKGNTMPLTMKSLNLETPKTKTVDVVERRFGFEVKDPFRWLEDVKSPETKEWMTQQNQIARAYLAKMPGREKLEARLRELLYIDAVFAPEKRGGRYFYMRRRADREKAVIYWKDGENGVEKILLDPNEMEPKGRVSIGFWRPSWDGQKVAYSVKENNADESILHILDVSTGKVSEIDRIPGVNYTWPSWTKDSKGFYYMRMPVDPKIPPNQRIAHADIRWHEVGTDPSKDPQIFPPTRDPSKFASANVSSDGKWLFIDVAEGWNNNDVYAKDLTKPNSKLVTVIKGAKALTFVDAWNGLFYIRTNLKAPRYQIMVTRETQPGSKHWRPLISERKDAVIESYQLIGGHIALSVMRDAKMELELYDLAGNLKPSISTPGIGVSRWVSGEVDDNEAYYTFTSFLTPSEVHRFDVSTGKSSLWAKINAKIDPKPFEVTQEFFASKDGTKVPMFIVRRKGAPLDGSTPMVLNGYGGFNISRLPEFAPHWFPWLEAGGAMAVVNLRGGGEYGEDWHKAGMRDKKQNVFDDFIGAGEHLIRRGFTSNQKLAIRGGSNGGLLVGAAMTQRPDLFKAVLCGVPVLDMLRYHKVGLGTAWIPEYGNPDVEKDFKTLIKYSPYHNVKVGTPHPSTLILAADNDDRVDPMHARKFAALLQSTNGGSAPVLMRIEPNAGHGGADQLKSTVEEFTDVFSFLFNELGADAGPFRN